MAVPSDASRGHRPGRANGVPATTGAGTTALAVTGLVAGDDGRVRPAWAVADPLLRDYYDREWGVPVRSEQGLFERLTLEVFQSGLAWRTILAKRPAFRKAFGGFDPETVAAFTDDDVARLLADATIVRNRRKIEATLASARATLALREDPSLGPDTARTVEAAEREAGLGSWVGPGTGGRGGAVQCPAGDRVPMSLLEPGLPVLVWSCRPAATPAPRSTAEVPTTSPEATALAHELRRRGFRHVGPVTVYSLMSAAGIVDLHLVGSYRRGTGAWPA